MCGQTDLTFMLRDCIHVGVQVVPAIEVQESGGEAAPLGALAYLERGASRVPPQLHILVVNCDHRVGVLLRHAYSVPSS